jgi:hypothetical protein
MRSQRDAALVSARGRPRDAIAQRRAAAATFRRLRHVDARLEALAGIVADGLAIGTPESMLAVLPDGVALIELHEERLARLGAAGSLYQVRHFEAYRAMRELLLRLSAATARLGPDAATHVARELVLHADRLQLRPARRQMAIFRAVAGDEASRRRLAAQTAEARPKLAEAAAVLSAAQAEGLARDDLRSGDPQRIQEILGKARPGESVYLESGTVSAGKPMTAEGGAYVQLRAARRAIRRALDASVQAQVQDLGGAVELPADWDRLTAGLTADDAIVAFLEFGMDQPARAAVITKADAPRIVELTGATLEQLRALVASAVGGLATNTAGASTALEQLARVLWRPLGPLPPRLTIVPNLTLVGFPFEALAARGGGLVVDSHTVRYALGLDDRIGRHDAIARPAAALVLGAEDFRRLRLAPLADARGEVAAIRARLQQAGIRLAPPEPMPRDGSALLAPVTAAGLVHVSTHSVWDAADTLFDRLAFPDADVSAVELALSPLRARLAIFSACSLLRNRGKGTQPVSGLAAASLAVVAPQLITTLWSVESRATRLFMTALHEHLLQWPEPSRALAETKRMLREPGRLAAWAARQGEAGEAVRGLTAPYYWAAFALAVRAAEE